MTNQDLREYLKSCTREELERVFDEVLAAKTYRSFGEIRPTAKRGRPKGSKNHPKDEVPWKDYTDDKV